MNSESNKCCGCNTKRSRDPHHDSVWDVDYDSVLGKYLDDQFPISKTSLIYEQAGCIYVNAYRIPRRIALITERRHRQLGVLMKKIIATSALALAVLVQEVAAVDSGSTGVDGPFNPTADITVPLPPSGISLFPL